MNKPARKKLEIHLADLILAELKKKDEKAAQKTAGKVKDIMKTIAKKFAKASVASEKAKNKLLKTVPLNGTKKRPLTRIAAKKKTVKQ